MLDSLGDELGEDDGGPGITGGVADVLLRCGPEGGVDDELFGRLVKGSRRRHVRDIGAVSDLRHRERTQQTTGLAVDQPLLMLVFVAEVEDRPAEEPELDAGLDLQAGGGRDGLFETGDIRGVFVLPAHLRGQAGHRQFGLGHLHDPVQGLRACRVEIIGRIVVRRRILGQGAAATASFGPVSVEDFVDGFRVKRQLHCSTPRCSGRVAQSQWVIVVANSSGRSGRDSQVSVAARTKPIAPADHS